MGFWKQTGNGNVIHINGDVEMPEETLQVLCEMFDKEIRMCIEDDELLVATNAHRCSACEESLELYGHLPSTCTVCGERR